MFMPYIFLLSCLCHTSSCHVYAVLLPVVMRMPCPLSLPCLFHISSCYVYSIPLLVVMFMPFFFLLSCVCYVPSHCHVYFISLLVMFIPYLFLLSCYATHLLVTMFMAYLFLIPCLCCTSFISSFQTQFARQSKIFSLPINQGKSFWRWEQMSDYNEDTVCITCVNCLRRKDPSG